MNGIGDYAYMDTPRRNIRHLMAGRSENQVGDESGVGQSWLHRYLSGEIKKGNETKLVALARYFGVSVAKMVFDDLTGTAVPASQTVGIDAPTLLRTLDFLDDLFEAHGKAFAAGQHVELVTAVYNELTRAPESNLIQLSVKYGKALEGRDGTGADAGVDEDGGRGDRGRAAPAKVAAGRKG